MLFNSPFFILVFLTLTLLGFFAAARFANKEAAITWLVVASVFFYGWWNPAYLVLISASIAVNYSLGFYIPKLQHLTARRGLLLTGIVFNLGLLGYFKYANFFVDSVNTLSGSDLHLAPIILPLAISFFTFQQIAYLVDSYQDAAHEYNFLHYCLFVTFFPQLIAGPIVHHKEMLPQFEQKKTFSPSLENFTVGLTIFILGLSKKVLIADSLAGYATPVFTAADAGVAMTFFEAWGGALAYTFQLYFDFSGYSDMAIGLARLFGIRLPLNFHSPYKALSIIDFWRRWHMTLSRFLRDYIYIPLGGSRKGSARRYTNLLITMLLGGLWHGAGWTFVIWGGVHGAYLVVNHFWRKIYSAMNFPLGRNTLYGAIASWAVTFVSVVVAWVFFRAESLEGAQNVLMGMAGFNGALLPLTWVQASGGLLAAFGIEGSNAPMLFNGLPQMLWIGAGAFIALLLPNVQQLMRNFKPAFDIYPHDANTRVVDIVWKPNVAWSIGISILGLITFGYLARVSEFLYFQF